MKSIFDKLSISCSRSATRAYSTSFSIGIMCLRAELRDPVHSVYGFVRLADEIVDSFHDYDQAALLRRFRHDTYQAIEERISLNPVLNAYQATVHQYDIPLSLTDVFLRSMEMDLSRKLYDEAGLQEYILGSAEAVGLMCLRIFCQGDEALYQKLTEPAMRLGAAFQKVNFLRDLKYDTCSLGRYYFSGLQSGALNSLDKEAIEKDIEKDFNDGFKGIKMLPRSARFGVYVAYKYYLALFEKIRKTPAENVLQTRIRIPDSHKATLLAYSFVKHQLNRI